MPDPGNLRLPLDIALGPWSEYKTRPNIKRAARYVGGNPVVIPTLEGPMQVSPGDFIVRGLAGEYYACKPEIFAQSYELVQLLPGYDGRSP